MKIQICSKSEVLIAFGSNELILKNNYSIIEIDSTTIFKVYPIGETNEIPFSFAVKNVEEKWTCSSCFVNCTIFPSYLKLELSPPKILQNNMPILANNLTVKNSLNENLEIKIFKNTKNNLLIKGKNFEFNDFLHSWQESNITKIADFILISYKCENSYYIYIYSINENVCALHCEAQQFELDETKNKLVVLQKLNDSLNHGKILEISLNDKFEILKQSLTYLDGQPESVCKEIELFDCAKAGNFKKAQELITLELKSVLSKESLAQYFKEYSQIIQSEVDFCFYLIKETSPKVANKIEFEYKDDLINNLKILYN